ncbi:leucine-rich repeat domain-containing protein [bacterium]|nr:leucine-rich repeat domain-containing protein [bacterium]
MGMRKKGIVACILILMLCAVVACSFALAFYKKSYSGWQQNISATSVVFRLNGKTVEEVTNYDLGLISRGKEAEIDFEVTVRANSSRGSIAKFLLNFQLEGENNELAKAIEVYKYENGRYVFVDMLDTFENIEGILPINTERNHHYKFVYSPAASNYFENKSFNLRIVATSSIYKGETDLYFVSSFEGLEYAAEQSSTVANKTLVITKDIAFPYDYEGNIVFQYPISIDLSGNTLDLKTNNIVINGGQNKLNITNSVPDAVSIVGEGKIIYNFSSEGGGLLFVDDNLNSFYSRIEANNVDFSAAGEQMQNQLNDYSQGVLIKGQKIDFAVNLKYYFSLSYGENRIFSIIPPMDGEQEDTSVVQKIDLNATSYVISDTYDIALTQLNIINFALHTADFQSAVLQGKLKIRGNSKEAIVEYYLLKIPDEIAGTVFFDGYDQATSSTISYVVSNPLISPYGIYLEEGIDSVSSWADAEIEIGIIIDTLGVQARGSKTVTVKMLSAKERTDKIYNYQQIILDEIGSEINIFDNYIDPILSQKAELTSIEISFNDPSQNLNNVGLPYLEIISIEDMSGLKVLRKPNGDKAINIALSISFVYKNGEKNGEIQYITQTITKNVTVVGYTSATELSDPTRFLQQSFDLNDYINKQGYEFFVNAYTQHGAKIDYEVSEENKPYLYIQNDVYLASAGGNFALIEDEYIYFDTTYVYSNGEYEANLEGDYILYNEEYIDISTQKISGEIYYRYAKVTILPAKVPSKALTMATVFAYVWDNIYEGEKQYYTKDGEKIVYNMKLAIKGIYHNIPSEIEDYLLYSVLVKYFDSNLDGYIDYDEANAVWMEGSVEKLAMPLSFQTYYSVVYRYIDFSNLGITSVKGLEYFTNAIGYNFVNNNISDIYPLKDLYKMKYLDLSNNKVADIQHLSYLDNLEVLALRLLPISTIEPLQYLPNIRRLDLYYNENISTFEYLSQYKNLFYLDIRQASRKASASYDTSYYLSLIYDNNRANNVRIYRDSNYLWVAADAEIVAAKALSQLIVIKDVYTTLNIPNYYVYKYTVNGTPYTKEYNIRWETQLADYSYLVFNTVDGKTVGYDIVSPIVNRIIPITVSVTEVGSSLAVAVTRKFRINLLQSQQQSDVVYIEVSPGQFQIAKNLVKDTTLLNFLISISNVNTTGYVLARDSEGNLIGGDTTYLESKTISYSELNTPDINDHSDALRNANITSLEGLRYFKNVIHFALDLRGNVLENADLQELSYLENVNIIKLSGQAYDFSQISKYTEEEQVATIEGLTSLTSLYVYGCYNLNTDEVLSTLYQVYLANPSVSIYKDSDTSVWNPYTVPMQKFVQNLPSSYAFIDLNQEVSYYESGDSYLVNFYEVKNIAFTIDTLASTLIGSNTSYFSHTASGVIYINLLGYSDVVYDKIILKGNDNRSDIFAEHYIKLVIDFNNRIKVVDYPLSQEYVSLNEVFPGRDLRNGIMTRLSSLFGSASSAISIEDISSGYFFSEGYYYITMATIMALSFTGTLTIDGTYFDFEGDSALQGLQYTSVTSLKVSRDCFIGDGEYIANLSQLIIAYSGVDFSNIKTDLSNLISLRLGLSSASAGGGTENNRYAVLYGKENGLNYYNLAHFNNLKEFLVIDSNVYDWQGLYGLRNIDIEKFYIYATNDAFTNKNNNYYTTEQLVRDIYLNSEAITKDFRIGRIDDATDYSYQYIGTGWADAISGVTSVDYDAVKEYKEFASGIKSLNVKLNGVKHDYTEDQSLENNQVLFLPSTTYASYFGTSFQSNEPIERKFVIRWRILGIDATLLNTVFGIAATSSGFMSEEYFTNIPYCNLPAANNYEDRSITVNALSYDTYFVFQGVMGEGYIDNEGNYVSFEGLTNIYTFAYPVLILGTDQTAYQASINYRVGSDTFDSAATVSSPYIYSITEASVTKNYLSYAAFEDPNLRVQMFMLLAIQTHNTSGPYAKLGTIFYNAVSGGTTVLAGGYRIYRIIFTTTTVKAWWHSASGDTPIASDRALSFTVMGGNYTYLYLSSLKGIELLKNINNIEIRNNSLADMSSLIGLAGWENRRIRLTSTAIASTSNTCGITTLNFSENLINDISALKDMTKLVSLNFTRNMLQTTLVNGVSVFASSVKTITNITLLGNYQISLADITALRTAVETAGQTALTILNIDATRCVADKDTLIETGKIANYSSGSLSLSLNGATSVVTESDVASFLNDIAADTDPSGVGMADYTSVGFQLGKNFSLTRSINGNSYTLSLRNSSNLINSDGTPLSSMYYKIAQTTTDLLIKKVGTAYAANYQINLIDISGSSPTVLPFVLDGVERTQSDFDPSLWAYVMRRATNRGTYYSYTSPGLLSITSEIGMRSLKGMEYFANTNSVKIENQAYLTDLFCGNFSSLTALYVGKTGIREQGLASLRYVPNLNTLNLNENEGINFISPISYFDGVNTVNTTLAKLILSNLSNLQYLYINNQLNFDVYGGSTNYQNLLRHLDGDKYLFNLTPQEIGSNARTLSSFASLDIAKIGLNNLNRKKWYRDYNLVAAYEKYITDESIKNYSSFESNNAVSFINISSLLTYVRNLALLETALDVEREFLPDKLYQYGIEESGVEIYLPKNFYYAGQKYKFIWELLEGSGDYLTEEENGYILSINSYNYLEIEGVFDTLISLGYSVVNADTETVLIPQSIDTRKDIEIVLSELSYNNPTEKLAPYYIEVSNGEGGTHLVQASEIFDSGRFLCWIFNNKNEVLSTVTSANYADLNMTENDVGKYYIDLSKRANLLSMNISYEGISSIKGIEIFTSLSDLTINNGSVVSLEPIRQLSLTAFRYVSRRSANNFKINDFSPLDNSKDTLVTFEYVSDGNANIEDLSFLLSFNSLSAINIGGNTDDYNKTMSFRYIVNYFAANKPSTVITYNGVIQTRGDSQENKATKILSSLDVTNSDFIYIDNFVLKINDDIQIDNGKKTAKLMTYINMGGDFYPIIWQNLSSHISVGELIYHGESFVSPIDGTVIAENTVISDSYYSLLFTTQEYLDILIEGKGRFERNLSLAVGEAKLQGELLLARIKLGEYYFERIITIKD